MNPFLDSRRASRSPRSSGCRASRWRSRRVAALAGAVLGASPPGGAALAVVLLSAASALAAAPACAATLPYPQAVERSAVAARAVLARAGRESCLRGKLTNALLSLTRSCEKEARRDEELCALADRAVVVTPMTLAFLDDTSRQLLRLIAPASPAPAVRGAPEAELPAGETP